MKWFDLSASGWCVVVACCLTACASQAPHKPAPVVSGKTTSVRTSSLGAARKAMPGEVYVVKKGDTLSLIAGSRKLSVNQLATLNNLRVPYRLYIGQKLKLSEADSPGQVEVTPYQDTAVSIAPVKVENKPIEALPVLAKPIKLPEPDAKPVSLNSSSAAESDSSPVVKKDNTKSVTNWLWPVKGMVLRKFGGGSKGIDIGGQSGQAIAAAADGLVVYSGDKLKGYGNMIIIKHSDDFLSAYAHNSQLLVRENDRVKAGAHIADMGVTESGSAALHFEIRYKGKSVDPLQYLQ